LLIFIFLYLIYLKKRPPFRDGVIFSFFLILLFGARFCIEFVKEIQEDFEKNLPLDMGQWLSIPLIVAGFVLLAYLYKKGLTVEPQPEPEPVEVKPVNTKSKQGKKQHNTRNKRR
jgi:prolipoprotein diacylglyceryltransferase